MARGIKKWFMLQVWRIQQVAQVMTIALLAINLSLQIYTFMEWREGSVFATPYTGATMIMLILAAIIWGFAIFWDMRLRMWREQATVLIERNPYAKEKMSSKEIMVYGIMWLPVLDNLGKTDAKAKKAADALRTWLKKAVADEPILAKDLQDVFKYIGSDSEDLLDFD